MTEFEKELVRFVSGYLDAGVSAEDYVKAFSQRLLNSIGKQSKPNVSEDLEEEITSYIEKHYHIRNDETLERGNDALTTYDFAEIARHFAQWGAEHLKK